MRIFITAINGFLGGRMAAHLRARGHDVRGSARRPVALAAPTALMSLGDPFDGAAFEGCDLLIHAAHDFAPGAEERNLRGTRAWFEAAAQHGVSRQVFLGSYSSRADAPAEYGRVKYLLERMFLDAGHAVLRPGLVIGNGGLFARQRAALLRTPIVPVISGGRTPTAVIATGHFLAALDAVIESPLRGGAFNLFYEPLPSMREFVRAVKASSGQRTRFLSVPTAAAIALAKAAPIFGLHVPVDPDQIRSLAGNATAPWRSDLTSLLPGRAVEFTLGYALAALREEAAGHG